jgi:hypothetical protein
MSFGREGQDDAEQPDGDLGRRHVEDRAHAAEPEPGADR